MESTRPIRALMRGLDALSVLNLRDGATVSEVVGEVRLPRTTVYRILETLCDAGFVQRDPADDRYRLTVRVRGLSEGFEDEAWITQVARPLIHELSADIIWPVAIATLSDTAMLVREATDHTSPLATERYSAGIRMPLLASACGLAYLAHCPVAVRDSLLEQLARSRKPEDQLARARDELLRRLDEIRTQGHALVVRNRHGADDHAIAVPVLLGEQVAAALSVRVNAEGMSGQAAVERFLPKLRECARRIREEYSQHKAGAARPLAPAEAV